MSDPKPEPAIPKLSQELHTLLGVADGRDLTLGEIESELQGRGIGMLILLLTIPFALPIPNPTSTIFGAAIMILGVRLMLNTRSFLPKFILLKKVPHSLLERVVKASSKICGWIEKFSRPRLSFLHSWPAMRALIGLGVFGGGFVLAVPVIVPNGLPAISILLLTAGLMEEDGLFVLLGYVVGFVSWVYLSMFLFLGHEGVQTLWNRFF